MECLVNEYLSVFTSDLEKHELIAQVEVYYEEIENKKERLELLDLLNNPRVTFDYNDVQDFEDDYEREKNEVTRNESKL